MTDYIDRQAVIDVLCKRCMGNYCGVPCVDIKAIKQLPSAQPETPPYITEIKSEYEKWVSMPHINKPLAKALYEVWKKHDREDVSRNG